MDFRIGQQVSYPNHGVCKIEKIFSRESSAESAQFYSLRVLANNSLIYIPVNNARTVGVRPILNSSQCKNLMEFLGQDFDEPEGDWKLRTREYTLRLQTGDVYETAGVLKKLAYLARFKKLSFREQRMFEKAKFLVVSELAVVCSQAECQIEARVDELLGCACDKHNPEKAPLAAAATH